jgi:hypothetical protein
MRRSRALDRPGHGTATRFEGERPSDARPGRSFSRVRYPRQCAPRSRARACLPRRARPAPSPCAKRRARVIEALAPPGPSGTRGRPNRLHKPWLVERSARISSTFEEIYAGRCGCVQRDVIAATSKGGDRRGRRYQRVLETFHGFYSPVEIGLAHLAGAGCSPLVLEGSLPPARRSMRSHDGRSRSSARGRFERLRP